MNIYKVKAVTELNPEHFYKVVTLMTQAFAEDPIVSYIYRNEKEIRSFMEVCLRYYLKVGRCFISYDDKGRECGISLWNEPSGRPITAMNVIRNKFLFHYLRLLFCIRLTSTGNMLQVSDSLQRGHPKYTHWYLFLIASNSPGAGSSLMEYAIRNYGNQVFYLENSNPKNNNHFYHKHGFEDIGTIADRGYTILQMKRECDKNQQQHLSK